MNRTLILACSATKARSCPGGKIPAIERYDGPAWRTLRANIAGVPAGQLDLEIFALSAEHGLIDDGFPIEDYDRRMTSARSRELIDPTYERILDLLGECQLSGPIFFYGGELYRSCIRQAIQLAEMDVQQDIPVTYSSGSIGCQLHQLKAWLRKDGQ